MNITKENIDDLNALLKVNIVKADYEGNVETVLKDYRKKANIKGFRPGMVPIGLIRKMYGTSVKVEEIQKVLSENIHKYINDEKIDILGDPLPRENEEDKVNFEFDDDFTFTFEIGLAPVINLNLGKDNMVPEYKINIDDKMKNEMADNYTRQYGHYVNGETVEEKDVLKGDIAALNDNGEINPDGYSAQLSMLSIDAIKDEDIKKSFIDKKIDDSIDFEIQKAFPNDYEIAGLLQKKKEEIGHVTGNFRFTIREITRFQNAERNQELFDKIFGEGNVTSEEDFMKHIEEELSASLQNETEYKLMLDMKELAVKNTEFDLPEDFLKKWLVKTDKFTEEQIEKDFDSFRKDLKWQLIRNKIAKDNDMKISEEEMQEEAEKITRQQFQRYGLYYASDEQVANFAQETLKKEEEAKGIASGLLDNKVLKILRDMVHVEERHVSTEDFNKLFE